MAISKAFSGNIALTLTDEEDSIDNISQVSVDTRTTSIIKAINEPTLEVISRIEGSYTSSGAGNGTLIHTFTAASTPDILVINTNNPLGIILDHSTNLGELSNVGVQGLLYWEIPTVATGTYAAVTVHTKTGLVNFAVVEGLEVAYLILGLKRV